MNKTAVRPRPVISPFELDDEGLYRRWRERKLKDYPRDLAALVVEIDDPRNVSDAEHAALLQRLRKCNMALYATRPAPGETREIPHAIGQRLGLTRLNHNWLGDEDGLTSLTVAGDGVRTRYIPYTTRPIKWHTDGYYNRPREQIRALNLHCVHPAASGGENRLMDHEIAYMLLRDENPDYIRALMSPRAMTIPARLENGRVARETESGPVFSVEASGDLHMRYTMRAHNILWHDDPLTRNAVEQLRKILEYPSSYNYRGRLEAGMGLISNNVLHDRAAFVDDEQGNRRLIYRARYFDRIPRTGVKDVHRELFE